MEMKKTKALTEPPKRRTRAEAIRAKCLDCCCDLSNEVKACEMKHCPLWAYRLGYEVTYSGRRMAKGKVVGED